MPDYRNNLRIKRFGWKPDVGDCRDHYRTAAPPAAGLPEVVDLRNLFPPCYDQGDLGSCTANAVAGLLEFDQHKQLVHRQFTPSRLFIYYGERFMEGTVMEDAGAMIRSGIKVVTDDGAPPEAIWPYKTEKFTTRPSNRAYEEAKKHQAISYQRVYQRIEDIRNCLANGFPFAFGFSVYDSFESDEVAETGKVNYPRSGERMLGGHAVVAVGYDHPNRTVAVRNSWGTKWGLNGYFTMPYSYILDKNLADDFWEIKRIEG